MTSVYDTLRNMDIEEDVKERVENVMETIDYIASDIVSVMDELEDIIAGRTSAADLIRTIESILESVTDIRDRLY